MKAARKGAAALLAGCCLACATGAGAAAEPAAVPAWAQDAVWYQIFPERFRNGDPSNDPTAASLDVDPARVPEGWRVSPWTRDWYARDDWERRLGDDFYRHGVFLRRYGGDLQGVIDRLDYLRDLGVTALYFNPVFHARSLHKYDASAHHHIDPHFGPDPAGDLAMVAGETDDPSTWTWTAADRLFLKLLAEAKARGLRVIIDGVFNHTGRDFFAFRDLIERGEESPYRDWFKVRVFDDPRTDRNEFEYEGWAGHRSLPEFAQADGDLAPGPRAYVFNATRRWMDPDGDGDPSDGVDGWRLDVAEELPARFWRDWNARVREINPDAYTSAEIWGDASAYLDENGFAAAMNYHGFALPAKGYLIDGTLGASAFAELLVGRAGALPAERARAMQNLVDSHDTDRVASMIVQAGLRAYADPARWDYDVLNSPRGAAEYRLRAPDARERRIQRLVALLQVAAVGAPMIYYGTEAGMWGADDPDDRMPMVWEDLVFEAQVADPFGRKRKPDPVAFDAALHAFYRAAFRLRAEEPALRRGGIRILHADEGPGLLVFAREGEGMRPAVVAINRARSARAAMFDRVPLAPGQGAGWELRLATSEKAAALSPSGGRLSLRVDGLAGAIFVANGSR